MRHLLVTKPKEQFFCILMPGQLPVRQPCTHYTACCIRCFAQHLYAAIKYTFS